MKICSSCLRELFDSDSKCDVCGNEKLITQSVYLQIANELECANVLKRKQLKKQYPYGAIYQYITNKNGERYWREIKAKASSQEIIYPSTAKQTPIVECPYCHSTNTKKISNSSKVMHIVAFGVFAMGRNSKNYHCSDCNSNF